MTNATRAFAASAKDLARNPLGIIALFIVLIYAFASLVVGFSNKLTPVERLPIIWFLMVFPIFVLLVFTWLVSRHHAKLYSPADYRHDAAFIEASIEQVEVAAAVGAATARRSKADGDFRNPAAHTRIAARRVATFVTPDALRASRSRRILWVDDHPENNEYERDALKALGFSTQLAESTNEAIAFLAESSFDVIISDMIRPNESRAGLALLKCVRSRGIETPYIIYSALLDTDQQAEAWKRGALGMSDKPDDLVLLVLEAVAPRLHSSAA